ncbi:hypothetical protein GCM10023354_04930 [Garicola koreensis]
MLGEPALLREVASAFHNLRRTLDAAPVGMLVAATDWGWTRADQWVEALANSSPGSVDYCHGLSAPRAIPQNP